MVGRMVGRTMVAHLHLIRYNERIIITHTQAQRLCVLHIHHVVTRARMLIINLCPQGIGLAMLILQQLAHHRDVFLIHFNGLTHDVGRNPPCLGHVEKALIAFVSVMGLV